MLTIRHAAGLDKSVEVRQTLDQASGWLQEVVDNYSAPIDAEWETVVDMKNGEPIVLLHLATASTPIRASGGFRLKDLKDKLFADPALRSLYIRLLTLESDALFKKSKVEAALSTAGA